MHAFFKVIFQSLLSFFYPPFCHICQEVLLEATFLCAKCWGTIDYISPYLCHQCGYPMPYEMPHEIHENSYEKKSPPVICAKCDLTPPPYDILRAATFYTPIVRNLIVQFKYSDKTELSELFANWLYLLYKKENRQFDYIIPVPLHFKRFIQRKYNQASLLAKGLSKKTHIPLFFGLRRARYLKSQKGLNWTERRHNLKNAFYIKNPRPLYRATVLLIDDVVTTGATIEACSMILKQAGVKNICVFTLSRVIYRKDT